MLAASGCSLYVCKKKEIENSFISEKFHDPIYTS